MAVALSVLLTGTLVVSPARANEDRVYLECPCTVERDGSTFRITAGIRNFRSQDTGPLHLGFAAGTLTTRAFVPVASIKVTDSLAPGESLASATYEIAVDESTISPDARPLEFRIYQEYGYGLGFVEVVPMESPVDLTGDFTVSDREYLKDSDEDGVGDRNEGIQGTDPDDADSTPADPTIDVLALYSQGFPALTGNDPTTRIQHNFTLANQYLADSGVGFRFRVVGMVEARIDEALGDTDDYIGLQEEEMLKHNADLAVWFRPKPPNTATCGFASSIGGVRKRGHFDFDLEFLSYATVFAGCSASTLTHELGHLMGLGHASWQNSVGTWRWSRGHAVDDGFGTLMTYGPQNRNGTRLDVFSSPLTQCQGLLSESEACGVDSEQDDGADAVLTLNAVRFQIAAFQDALPDADEDGFVDPVDDLPQDGDEWSDTDGDGTGNNADTDDDGDGVSDDDDVFPLDGSESVDTDGDGTGDNSDAFPMDATETTDTDSDGVGDNADHFPDDPAETVDTDGDGVGDNGDVWPENPAEHTDTDGDEIGNNADTDDDNDGLGDNLDPHPLDATKTDLASYEFVGEQPGDQVGNILASSPSGDQRVFVIGAPLHDADSKENSGAVYLVSEADLASLDVADGRTDRVIGLGHVTSGANSWKLTGENAHDQAGTSVSASGDFNGDGQVDLVIGAPYFADGGAVYVLSGAVLATADAADGVSDRVIQLDSVSAQAGSWKLVGEAAHDDAGTSVAAVPDTNHDGMSELLVGARGHDPGDRSGAGAAYFLSSGDFSAADSDDDDSDGVIGLGNVSSQTASWKLVGEAAGDSAGYRVASAGDMDNDGNTDVVITAPYRSAAGGVAEGPVTGVIAGAAYLISVNDLAASDSADGLTDSVIDLGNVAGQPGSWRLFNGGYGLWATWSISSSGKTDGSTDWLLVGNHLVSWEDLATADAADDSADGVVDLRRLVLQPGSWHLIVARNSAFVGDMTGDGENDILALTNVAYLFPPTVLAGTDTGRRSGAPADGYIFRHEVERSVESRTISGARLSDSSPAGDVDSDGLADVLMGGSNSLTDTEMRGSVYLLLGIDLGALDRADGREDRSAHLANFAGDTDGDGFPNTVDRDDDGDGYADSLDTFQLDPNEWADNDLDGVGDNTDAFPGNRREWLDTDGDGLGDFYEDDDDDGDGIADSSDQHPLDTDNDGMENGADPDDDGDGVLDAEDDLPLDGTESTDTDGDGTGNNADTDDDNDGVLDSEDALPLDARDSVDTDGDGIGDTTDAFPNDAAETADFDGDGIGDNADTDDDNDGIADADDDYPFDASFSMDTDGDGVPDSLDRYPTNRREWENTDGAGFGDNRDTDDDNDGVLDTDDLFPKDASRSDLSSVRLATGLMLQEYRIGLTHLGDLDGDGSREFAIGAPGLNTNGVIYVISPADLTNADQGDGVTDGSARLTDTLAQPNSWKLEGQQNLEAGRLVFPFNDIDGDGVAELFVSAQALVPAGYIVSGGDLAGADAADGTMDSTVNLGRVAAQPKSWKLWGLWRGDIPNSARPADLNGDGVMDLVIVQPGDGVGNAKGTVYVLSANTLSAIDALDGTVNGTLELGNASSLARWRLEAENHIDLAGGGLTLTDFDGDGQSELVVGAPYADPAQNNEGAVYLIEDSDLAAADLADGNQDQMVELGNVAAQPNSWKIIGDTVSNQLGRLTLDGDLDGDGRSDLVLRTLRGTNGNTVPILRILSGAAGNLSSLDAADGTTDGTIATNHITSGVNRELTGPEVARFRNAALLDFDGDGKDDLLLGLVSGTDIKARVAHLIASSALFGATNEFARDDLSFDEKIRLSGSYQIHAPEAEVTNALAAVSTAGDVDGDGLDDLLIAVTPFASNSTPNTDGAAYLIMAVDLPHLDAADGMMDGKIFLRHLVRERH